MPLKVTGNTKGVTITWGTPDGAISSTFQIKPEMDDQRILEVLRKATIFIGKQMGDMAIEIAELETELGSATPAAAAGTATSSISPTATTAPQAGADSPGVRVQMMPPGSLSDRPSDGGPPSDNFGWGSMPTTSVPAHLQQAWEIIPPGEA